MHNARAASFTLRMDCVHLAPPTESKAEHECSSNESNQLSCYQISNGQNSASCERVLCHDLVSSDSGKETDCRALTGYGNVIDACPGYVQSFELAEVRIAKQKEMDCLGENMSCISSPHECTANSSSNGVCSEETVNYHSTKNLNRMSFIKSDENEISSLKNSCSDATSAKDHSQCLEEQVELSLPEAVTTESAKLPDLNKEPASDADAGNNKKEKFPLQSPSTNCGDGSSPVEIEVNICDICGDLGYERSLAVCRKCRDGAEHTYCMRVKLDNVPDGNWVCEECTIAEKAEKQQKDDSEKVTSSNSLGKELQRTSEISHGNNSKRGKRGNGVKRSRERIKVNSERPVCGSKEISAGNRMVSLTRKSTTRVSASVKNLNMANSVPVGVFPRKKLELRSLCKSSSKGSLVKVRPCNITDLKHRAGQWRESNFVKSIPGPVCIWQGGFQVQRTSNASSYWDGIQAHLSSYASQKALELAHGFPRNILLEEVPRSTVWSTQFSDQKASIENATMFFFPKDQESGERSYKILSECMIKNDACLKGDLGGFKLLIFSSKMLPEEFQRWNGFFYLWSVFRGKNIVSPGSSRTCSAPEQDCSKVLHVDFSPGKDFHSNNDERGMEIDEGGRETKRAKSSPHNSESNDVPNLELSLGFAGTCNGEVVQHKHCKPTDSGKTQDGLSLSLALSVSHSVGPHEIKLFESSTGTEQSPVERLGVNTSLSLVSWF